MGWGDGSTNLNAVSVSVKYFQVESKSGCWIRLKGGEERFSGSWFGCRFDRRGVEVEKSDLRYCVFFTLPSFARYC